MSTKEATPRPWQVSIVDGSVYITAGPFDVIPAKTYICQMHESLRDIKANAELIVRAVNAHDDLLAACKALVDLVSSWQNGIFKRAGVTWTEPPPAVTAAEQAIAKATQLTPTP